MLVAKILKMIEDNGAEVIIGDGISIVILKYGITDMNVKSCDLLHKYVFNNTVFEYVGDVSRYSQSDIMFIFFNDGVNLI